jgi:serine/threonine protein kinase
MLAHAGVTVETKLTFPQSYGKYELLERIGEGGMAEVFRARLPGAAGFEKILVLKRILPHLAKKPDFVSMFVDEAKLAAKIQHQNVVQVFELGEAAGGELYMAMEFVSGVDLRRLLINARDRRLKIPVWFVLHVLGEVLSGLAYAHELVDSDGRALQVVHRDVTPGNIFISWQGEVKLADFGIAKAVGRVSETEAGQVKGNAPFMSPEAIYGRVLDARADVFSAGVVLWASLALRLPFEGASNYETAKKVCEAKREAPSKYNKDVSPELDQVALHALEIQREKRIGSAREFQARLLEIQSKLRPKLLPSDVRHVVDVLSGRKPPDAQFAEMSPPSTPTPGPALARSKSSGDLARTDSGVNRSRIASGSDVDLPMSTPVWTQEGHAEASHAAKMAMPMNDADARRSDLIEDLGEGLVLAPPHASHASARHATPAPVHAPDAGSRVGKTALPMEPSRSSPAVAPAPWPPGITRQVVPAEVSAAEESYDDFGPEGALGHLPDEPLDLQSPHRVAPQPMVLPGVPTAPFMFNTGAQPPAAYAQPAQAPAPLVDARRPADSGLVLRDVPLATMLDYMADSQSIPLAEPVNTERYYNDAHPFHVRYQDGTILTATGLDECLQMCDPHGRTAVAISCDRETWVEIPVFARLCGFDYLAPDTTPLKKVKMVGVIEERSLASVFNQLSTRRMTGKLVIMDKGVTRVARREIDVVGGAPVHVYGDHAGLQFPRLYVQHDLLKKELVPELVVQVIKQRQSLEEIARRQAFIDLNPYRAVLMRDRLAELFSWRYGRFAFDAGREMRGATPFASSVLKVLPDAVQRGYTAHELRHILEPYLVMKMKRVDNFDAVLAEMGLKDKQMTAARRLGQRTPLGKLLERHSNEMHVQLAMAFILIEIEALISA